MNWFKNMGGFFGYIIGAVIILPLLLIGHNYFFIHKNDAEKYVPAYIANSVEIHLHVPNIGSSKVKGDKLYF